MKYFLIVLTCALLAACEYGESTYVSDRCERQKLFKECMAALPPPAPTHYADYDEMVDTCDTVALYQTVRLRVPADAGNTCVVPKR